MHPCRDISVSFGPPKPKIQFGKTPFRLCKPPGACFLGFLFVRIFLSSRRIFWYKIFLIYPFLSPQNDRNPENSRKTPRKKRTKREISAKYRILLRRNERKFGRLQQYSPLLEEHSRLQVGNSSNVPNRSVEIDPHVCASSHDTHTTRFARPMFLSMIVMIVPQSTPLITTIPN